MKLVFGSDIHGSAFWCDKFAERVRLENPNQLVLVGDLLYHGPRNDLPEGYNPKKVIEILSEFKDIVIAVRGNCDSEVDDMVLPFPIMSDYNIIYDGENSMFVSHGHIYGKADMEKISPAAVLVNGHTHIYEIENTNFGKYVNIGSIGLPKENRTNTYAVYENSKFYIKDLEGNVVLEG